MSTFGRDPNVLYILPYWFTADRLQKMKEPVPERPVTRMQRVVGMLRAWRRKRT